jgi:NADPH:quinone reductase-like Zn-dependent oxidoreductase
VLGSEFAGRISPSSPIPKDCPFKAGDRVFGGYQGTFAENMSVPWDRLMPLPDAMTFDQGAGRLMHPSFIQINFDIEPISRSVCHVAYQL